MQPALKYLSRYLYRGVISDRQLVADDGETVTFSYRDGQSGKRCTRTVKGAHFSGMGATTGSCTAMHAERSFACNGFSKSPSTIYPNTALTCN